MDTRVNTAITLPKLLVFIAVVCFVVTALSLANLTVVGLAFWASAALIS